MTKHVCIRTENRAGVITLNRPTAMNALNLAMVRKITNSLHAWRDADEIDFVIIESASENAFCAGGDLREVHSHVVAGRIANAMQFFHEEYDLNLMIANYPKPYIALIDGICMGGGIGISLHGKFRIVTERALLAMPEVAIGMFPDVGMSYKLPRLSGSIGYWLALTGSRLSAFAALEADLATHFVRSESLPKLRADLVSGSEVNLAIASYAELSESTTVGRNRQRIAECFGLPSITEVVAALRNDDSEWGIRCLDALHRASPYSLQVTMELLTQGRADDLATCLARELEAVRTIVQHGDFMEGVRAILIDKDRNPRWTSTSAF